MSKPAITAMNERPLMKNAPASPVVATARPAMAGPMVRAALKMVELSPMALDRSLLPSTISTIKDWRAGMSMALAAPNNVASTITCHTWTAPVQVNAARIKAWTIMIVWAMTMIERLEKRSASEPPHSDSGTSGSTATKLTRPIMLAWPVRRYTSHCWAMVCIQVPMTEISWPKKNRR